MSLTENTLNKMGITDKVLRNHYREKGMSYE